jgi:hypothetical protein
MTDRFITEIVEPDQTVIVRVEEDVVAIEVDFRYPDAEKHRPPDMGRPPVPGRIRTAGVGAH